MRGRRLDRAVRALAVPMIVVLHGQLAYAQATPPAAPTEPENPAPAAPSTEGAPVAAPAESAAPPDEATPPPGADAPEGASPATGSTGATGGIVTNQQVRDGAREAYTEGQQLFAAGSYPAALAAFQRAYEAVPKAIVLLPIAECQIRLGDVPGAVASFERYLQESPGAPDRAEIEKRLAELRDTPATLTVTSEVKGLRLAVDGTAVAVDALPFKLELEAGEHTLEAAADGYEPGKHTVTVAPGEQASWDAKLEPVAAPEPPKVATPLDDVPSPLAEDNTTALWVAGVVGATGLVAGSVLGFMALSENSDFDSGPTADTADRGERLALFSDVAFGVGAMALITGAVLYLTEGEVPGEEQASRPFDVAAAASPDGAFVSTTVRY